ncbi:hypothetical protein B2J93_9368 [Marssonina coronariae]|uniref:Uncharacterized protein n=1 Tax=Diplocarpon coronariae TaxID=2795749 RepID=A0A218Z9N0_9HELO|nr:hypothetical protein B2J93_9368 [Marssonina coronariae]
MSGLIRLRARIPDDLCSVFRATFRRRELALDHHITEAHVARCFSRGSGPPTARLSQFPSGLDGIPVADRGHDKTPPRRAGERDGSDIYVKPVNSGTVPHAGRALVQMQMLAVISLSDGGAR